MHNEAIALYAECLQKRKTLLGENHPDSLETMGTLGQAYAEQGNIY